jgi:hypothetical protein
MLTEIFNAKKKDKDAAFMAKESHFWFVGITLSKPA